MFFIFSLISLFEFRKYFIWNVVVKPGTYWTLCQLNSINHSVKERHPYSAAVCTWPLFPSLRHNFCWHFSRVASPCQQVKWHLVKRLVCDALVSRWGAGGVKERASLSARMVTDAWHWPLITVSSAFTSTHTNRFGCERWPVGRSLVCLW